MIKKQSITVPNIQNEVLDDQIYKVGDHIIDYICIHKITKISEDQTHCRLVHYQPIQGTDKIYTDTIPEKNLSKGGLRFLLNQKEIKILLQKLTVPISDYLFDIRQVKDDIYSNMPLKLIEHLKYFYKKKDTVLPRAEQDLKDDMINHLCLEISFVTNVDISQVKKKIESKLSLL